MSLAYSSNQEESLFGQPGHATKRHLRVKVTATSILAVVAHRCQVQVSPVIRRGYVSQKPYVKWAIKYTWNRGLHSIRLQVSIKWDVESMYYWGLHSQTYVNMRCLTLHYQRLNHNDIVYANVITERSISIKLLANTQHWKMLNKDSQTTSWWGR